MVPAELVPNAVTLYSANVNLSRMIGPTLAALLIATVGYGWSFALDAASYVAVLASLFAMRDDELRPAPKTLRGRGQVRAGLRYVAEVPELWITFLTLLVVGVLSYNFTVVLPLFVEKGLHGSDSEFALIYATFSAGAVVGTLVVARRTAMTVRTVVGACLGLGVSMLAMAFVPNVGIAFPAAALVGATSVVYLTVTTALVQVRAERHMVGRVLALQAVLLIGTTPIGGPILGLLADSAGGRAPVVLGAAGALLAGVVAAFFDRQRRSRN
jgi:predicted MFS family arabinose efflux permease